MSRSKIIRILIALALILLLAIRGAYLHHPHLQGQTMGTTYHIVLPGYLSRAQIARLSEKIQTRLAQINHEMSTWEKESEISQFNQFKQTTPFPVSKPFFQVSKVALQLSKETDGAFDPTLNPLLNLWGFGSGGAQRKIPSDAEIDQAKALTGWHRLHLHPTPSPALSKEIPELQLDYGAIAKGYGVDEIGRLLTSEGLKNWMVEIGGEVSARGFNPEKKPWRIGIQFPSANPLDGRIQGIAELHDAALATSGDYRNYILQGEHLYSHILDPRTGYAALSSTASVTVLAPDCMHADGVATALFVMGAQEGLEWVESHPQIEAMFLVRSKDGKISEKFSSGFFGRTSYTATP